MLSQEAFVPMSDGFKLYTMVTGPGGKSPIILVRSPYVPQEDRFGTFCDDNKEFVQAGYTVVFQHCRGCGRSEGEFLPYQNERQDGLDTLDWIRKQDFYAGEIYPVGGSYNTSVHFAYLSAHPADVKGAVLAIQDMERYNILYRNGFYKVGLNGGWFAGIYRKRSLPNKNYSTETFRMLPLTRFAETVFGEEVPTFTEELRHPWPEDSYWQTPVGGSDYHDALEGLDIPILFVTAWHDIYTEGIFRMWERLSDSMRKKSALLVFPYQHDLNVDSVISFPNGRQNQAAPDYKLRFLEHIRKGTSCAPAVPGKITWYSMFENVWRTEEKLKTEQGTVRFFLQEHALSPEKGPEQKISYLYNPFAPAEFKGGCCCNFGGMQIQANPDFRYDVRSFLTEPLKAPLRIQGCGEVRLTVSSDCPDTCFYVRLSIVRSGIAYGTRDDIVSLRRQNPDYRPGERCEVKLHLTENAFVLGIGDQLRLDVSSSCWPYYVPHTNRAGLFSEQTGADVAHNTVFTGLSTLTLDGKFL